MRSEFIWISHSELSVNDNAFPLVLATRKLNMASISFRYPVAMTAYMHLTLHIEKVTVFLYCTASQYKSERRKDLFRCSVNYET